jgi:hypothetical protein
MKKKKTFYQEQKKVAYQAESPRVWGGEDFRAGDALAHITQGFILLILAGLHTQGQLSSFFSGLYLKDHITRLDLPENDIHGLGLLTSEDIQAGLKILFFFNL